MRISDWSSDVCSSDLLRVTFVGHATFLLETPEGATLATDYNGRNLPRRTPDIATMNNFHITHYTDFPDPGLKHILRGWDARSEERRVGTACVRTGRSRGSPYH